MVTKLPLARYVPDLVIHHLHRIAGEQLGASAIHHVGIVLHADISGFTALTERLAASGRSGADLLSNELNAYFAPIITHIDAYGGDVLNFAGDALTAFWPIADEDDLPVAARQAITCAQMIQRATVDKTTSEGGLLGLRMGIGIGDVTEYYVGGEFNRWAAFVAGPAIVAATDALGRAQVGQAVLAPMIGRKVGWPTDGPLDEDGYRLLIPNAQVSTAARPPTQRTRDELPTDAQIQTLIPATVLARLQAGQGGWLAEIRTLTILFVHLTSLRMNEPVDNVNRMVETIQLALYRFEGSLNKISVDDKGVALLAAMGLPPLAHEDDARRGVHAALEIQLRVHELGHSCSIGVTTGRVFCGVVGSNLRCEYTVIGPAVNLAARFMMEAKQQTGGTIFCDQSTHDSVSREFNFEVLPSQPVRGIASPLPIYKPAGLAESASSSIPTLASTLVGRTDELACLLTGLDKAEQGESSVILVEGEAGIGKSRLLAELIQAGKQRKVELLTVMGDALEKSAAFYAWRTLLAHCLGINLQQHEQAHQRRQVMAFVNAIDPALTRHLPLLNDVLHLGFADNDLTRELTGKARNDNTRRLLIEILQSAASTHATLLVVDDAQWLDLPSWGLVSLAARQIRPLVLVIAARPMNDSFPEEYQHLCRASGTKVLELEPLPDAEILALIEQRLGVGDLPEHVAKVITDKSEGHPFFAEELASFLRDSGALRTEVGASRLMPGIDVEALDFPDTIEGMITSRIDRLTPQQQLTFKVASVIGRIFSLHQLHAVHPIEADRSHLPDHLARLSELDLAQHDAAGPDPVYSFKHGITREVAYNLMVGAQRQGLHRAVANHLEETYASDLSPHYALLAHHYDAAQDASKTIEFGLLTASQAKKTYANRIAIEWYTRVLALLTHQGLEDPPTRSKAVHGHKAAGEVFAITGQFQTALEHFFAARELLHAQLRIDVVETRLAASLCTQIARIYEMRAELPTANGWIHRGLALLDGAEPGVELAELYCVGGWILRNQDELAEAEALESQSIAIARDLGNHDGQRVVAEASSNLGAILLSKHDYHAAAQQFEQSIQYYERIGDVAGQQHGYTNLGIVAGYLGDMQASYRAYHTSLLIAEQTGDQYRATLARENLVVNELISGNLMEAEHTLHDIIAQWSLLSDREGEANGWTMLAQLQTIQEQWSAADASLDHASDLVADIESLVPHVDILSVRAALSLARGETTQARIDAESALAMSVELQDKYYEGLNTRTCGEAYRQAKAYDRARPYLDRSHALFAEINHQYELERSTLALAQWFLDTGDNVAARKALSGSIVRLEKMGATLDVQRARDLEQALLRT